MRAAGLSIVACTPDADAASLYDVVLPARAAVLVGAEGDGLTAAARAHADIAGAHPDARRRWTR